MKDQQDPENARWVSAVACARCDFVGVTDLVEDEDAELVATMDVIDRHECAKLRPSMIAGGVVGRCPEFLWSTLSDDEKARATKRGGYFGPE